MAWIFCSEYPEHTFGITCNSINPMFSVYSRLKQYLRCSWLAVKRSWVRIPSSPLPTASKQGCCLTKRWHSMTCRRFFILWTMTFSANIGIYRGQFVATPKIWPRLNWAISCQRIVAYCQPRNITKTPLELQVIPISHCFEYFHDNRNNSQISKS